MARNYVSRKIAISKAKELDNSKPFYFYRLSDYPNVIEALNEIFSEAESSGLFRRKDRSKYRNHFRVIVLALYVEYSSDPSRYIAYPRSPNAFSEKSRYKPQFITFRIFIKVIDFLLHRGYAEGVLGFRTNEKSKLSRIRATKKLIDLVEGKHKVTLPMIEHDDREEVIILRNSDKRNIEYDDTHHIIRMRERVKFINKVLQKNAILLYITDKELFELNKRLRSDPNSSAIDFTQKRLFRVFNDSSFKRGGRFYGGWWQTIPKEYRKYIRINDKDVVECDYSGLHITMLYAMEGQELHEDPYILPNYGNIRDFLKRLLLICINAKDLPSAIRAIKDRRPSKRIEIPEEIDSIENVLEAFIDKHKPIADYFFSGIGTKLQFHDSQITEHILLHFAKNNYAVLPVHDSYIIHHALEKELRNEMRIAFCDIFGVNAKIDLKYNSIKHREENNAGYSGVCDLSFEVSLNYDRKYSIYNKLLNDFRNKKNSINFHEINRRRRSPRSGLPSD